MLLCKHDIECPYGEDCEEVSLDSPYSTDKRENRVNRITSPRQDIEKAKEFMDGPGGDMAREVARTTVAIDDVGAGSASFLTDLRRKVKAYNASVPKCERLTTNDHVMTMVRRMLCAEMPEFAKYAALSKARYDALLYRDDPDKYEFLNGMLYGGALGDA